MSRRLARGWILALALATAGAAAAQGPAGGPEPSDVPSGPARVVGRVVHSEGPAAGVSVLLYALPSGGAPGLRRAVTDADGAFAFEGISNRPDTVYLVGARYGGVPFPGARVLFGPDELERRVEVRVTPVRDDAGPVAIERLRVRLDALGSSLLVDENLTLRNEGSHTWYRPPAGRTEADSPVRLGLPRDAGEFRMPLGVPPEGLVRRDDEASFYGPVYPGSQELGWAYEVALREGRFDLTRRLPAEVGSVELWVPADAPRFDAGGLVEGERRSFEGREYRVFEAQGLGAGTSLTLALELPPARTDPDAVSLAEVRVILDWDDASVRAREEHRLRVAGDTPVVAPAGGRLLGIRLPDGAQDLRFGPQAASLGILPGADGSLSVIGPVPPGETPVEISYRLPVREGVARLERRFEAHLPLLSLYLADPGNLDVASARLHRRRPVRTDDLTYMHLEAFEIAAGESIDLRIAPKPPRLTLSRSAVVLSVLVLAAVSIAVLTAPLRRLREADGEEAEPSETLEARERAAVVEAIRDLDHDFETGKVDDDDYALLRGELRAKAVALLRAERDHTQRRAERDPSPHRAESDPAQPRAPEPAQEAPSCPGCRHPLRAGDRFCSQCGAALEPADAREASA